MAFRICMIGCGSMAMRGHGPSYRKYAQSNPDVELSACCDIDGDKANFFRNEFGFARSYTDFEEMLNIERPDSVCLIAPPQFTAPISLKILERKIPILLEKPPGLNRYETLELIKVAEKNKVPNQVAFNRRFMPLVRKLKSILNERHFTGEIQSIRCEFFRCNRRDADFATTAIHGIDTVRFLAGSDYSHISFHYQNLEQYREDAANIFLYCKFVSGAVAQLSFLPVSGVVAERYSINASNHTYFLDTPIWNGFDTPGRLLHIEGEKIKLDLSGSELVERAEMFETNGFYGENADFFDTIRAGKHPVDDIRSGLQSVEIADCIRNRKHEFTIGEPA